MVSWKLKPPHDAQTQGIVVSGFAKLRFTQALFLEFKWGAGQPDKSVLPILFKAAPITGAHIKETDTSQIERAAAIAFTWTGLKLLGLPDGVLDTFSAPFREGMYQEDRSRRLGDNYEGKWQKTVVEGGPKWSGNAPAIQFMNETAREAKETASQSFSTAKTVHALLLLYAQTQQAADTWAADVKKALSGHPVEIKFEKSLDLDVKNKVAREHFGFADGLSQPIPFDESSEESGSEGAVALEDNSKMEWNEFHSVPLGEILLGHMNAHHERAPSPIIPDCDKVNKVELEQKGAPEGFKNFGLNGSYMVVRELRQNVAGFWNAAAAARDRINKSRDPDKQVDAKWVAERIVGRDINGHMLCPTGSLPPAGKYPQNDFGFFDADRVGLGCPLGSHVRRANPRDGLAKNKAAAKTLLNAANNHRILRRGRTYGSRVSGEIGNGKEMVDDQQDRGLLFICLNTDIARQFEFIQQTWLLNQNFATLFDETDPLVGPPGYFTIPEDPLRRRVEVETFVQLVGGDYFFLPSMPALSYLAEP